VRQAIAVCCGMRAVPAAEPSAFTLGTAAPQIHARAADAYGARDASDASGKRATPAAASAPIFRPISRPISVE